MATPVLVGGATVYLPPDLQKTESDTNKANAFSDFIKKNIKNLNPAKSYYVQFKWIFEDGTKSRDWSPSYRLSLPADPPLAPTGFTAKKILGGVSVSWNGTYTGGTFFNGFKAINIYAGTSATTTSGTYTFVGQLTADRTNNSITVPVDATTENPSGVYVRYANPIYIHASSINQDGTESTIVANVASISTGAGRATDADINDGAVVIEKLASNVLTVDNLKAGTINSTSYIRAGSKNLINGTGARIEIASNTVEDGTYDILPGITVYNTAGTAIFRADLSGNVTIGGYQPAGSYLSTGGAAADVNSNSTNINGGKIRTGNIQSQYYTGVTDGSDYSTNGMNINLDGNASITSKYFRINTDGDAFFKGKVNAGDMSIGPNVDPLSLYDGIYIDSNDWWYGDGTFSFGSGKLTYDGTNLDLGTYGTGLTSIRVTSSGVIINVGEDGLDLSSITSNEDGSFGDTTLVRDSNGKMTIGRALYFKSYAPTTESSRPGGGDAFNIGDFWFTTAS